MEIDGYTTCPCHSEKKIKFCCGKDILADLNQLLSQQSAGQELAAIDEVDRAIKRHGPKDCLLTMKTQLLLEHDEFEKALQVNAQFREKNPQHPSGFHQLALIRLAMNDVFGAVDALQDAVDAVKGNELPVFLINGFRAVGIGLMAMNMPIAARAHFKFAYYLSEDQDQELANLYLRTMVGQDLGFLQRSVFEIAELTDAERQQEWAKKILTAQRASVRGQFRKSLKYLELASESYRNNSTILHAIAVLSSYLTDRLKTAAAWQRYSDCPGLDESLSIQAKILAMVYSFPECHDKLETMETICEIDDFNAAIEHALSHRLLRPIETSQWDHDGPPPRNSFIVINQPITDDPNAPIELIPHAIGSLDCFGKQTDRPARLVWQYDRIAENEAVLHGIQGEFQTWTVGEPKETELDASGIPYNVAVQEWLLPQEINPIDRQRMVSELLFRQLTKKWINQPTALLEGKSPKEAAGIPNLQRKLKGILICIQIEMLGNELDAEKFAQLWSLLNLQPLPQRDLGQRRIADLSPLELLSLNLDGLGDEELRIVAGRAMLMILRPVLRAVLLRLLDRPESQEKGFERHAILHQLGLVSIDIGQSLELLAQARTKAAQSQAPFGNYLVDEFQYRLSRGITDRLDDLLTLIYKAHIHEPNVAQRMGHVLQRFGLTAVADEHETRRPIPTSAIPHSPLFAPQDELGAKTESKLWLPD